MFSLSRVHLLHVVIAAAMYVPALGAAGVTSDTPQPLRVVVTLPVLKDWAQQVGGPHVTVTALMTGYESEHTYSPKPSDLMAIRKAHILVEIGAGLEVWVENLVKNAGNADLLVVTSSQGIDLIDDQGDPTGRPVRAEAHAHAHGNPHMWLDPEGASLMIRHIAQALSARDPVHRAAYEANATAYVTELIRVSEGLRAELDRIGDRRIIAHHPAWPYFARYFGLSVEGTLLTQPGADVSARQIRAIVERIKQAGIRVIVSEAQLSQKLPHLVAQETGARVVVLTTLPGALPGTETYLDMLRYNVLQLAAALQSPPSVRSPH